MSDACQVHDHVTSRVLLIEEAPTLLRQLHNNVEGSTNPSTIGDCYRTAIACLVAADSLEGVPHFVAESICALGAEPENGWHDHARARRWLRSELAVDLLLVTREAADELGVPYHMTVRSAVGPWNHTVIARSGEVIWCPSGGSYTMADAIEGEAVGVIVEPYDPGPDAWLVAMPFCTCVASGETDDE